MAKRERRKPLATGLQDGLLAYLLAQSGAADSNVEKRLDKEPFDFREHVRSEPKRK